jgi:hypothetical protein
VSWMDELDDLEHRAKARLAELDPLVKEYNELRGLVERLGAEKGDGGGATAAAPDLPAAARGPSRAAPSKRVARPSARGRRRSRRASARPGARQQQLIDLVTARPGITVPEIAAGLDVDPTGLYGIVRRLQASQEIQKIGMGLYIAGHQPSAPGVAGG